MSYTRAMRGMWYDTQQRFLHSNNSNNSNTNLPPQPTPFSPSQPYNMTVYLLKSCLLCFALFHYQCEGLTLSHQPITSKLPLLRSYHRSNVVAESIRRSKPSQIVDRSSLMIMKANDQPETMLTEDNNEVVLTNRWATPFNKPILASLDFIALTIFAAVGKASHSADGSLDFAAVFTTAFPFLVSWFATSPLTGIYNDCGENSKGEETENNEYLDVVKVTLKGWAVAIPLGCVGRGLIKGYVPPLPFVIVTLIATLVILSTIRLLYAALSKQLE